MAELSPAREPEKNSGLKGKFRMSLDTCIPHGRKDSSPSHTPYEMYKKPRNEGNSNGKHATNTNKTLELKAQDSDSKVNKQHGKDDVNTKEPEPSPGSVSCDSPPCAEKCDTSPERISNSQTSDGNHGNLKQLPVSDRDPDSGFATSCETHKLSGQGKPKDGTQKPLAKADCHRATDTMDTVTGALADVDVSIVRSDDSLSMLSLSSLEAHGGEDHAISSTSGTMPKSKERLFKPRIGGRKQNRRHTLTDDSSSEDVGGAAWRPVLTNQRSAPTPIQRYTLPNDPVDIVDWDQIQIDNGMDTMHLYHMDNMRLYDFIDMLENQDLLHNILDNAQQPNSQRAAETYQKGRAEYSECQICFELVDLHLRLCCHQAFCDDCLSQYVNLRVTDGNVKIQCPHSNCDNSMHTDEISYRLEPENKQRFYRFLVDANKDPYTKTCPRCSSIMEVKNRHILSEAKVRKRGWMVLCPDCRLAWCFPCQAPWHEGISCKDFRKGDKLLRTWAKEEHYGQVNAQKCPRCKIFIQRSTGCDHMTCNQCCTNFCYRCGEQFRSLKFVGDHYSRLSIFGCKYRLFPTKPARRRFIRGSIFAGKLMVAPVAGALAVAMGAVALGLGVFALPVWGGIKLHRKIKQKKREKERQDHMQRIHEELQNRGDPYMEHWQRSRSVVASPGSLSSASSSPLRIRRDVDLDSFVDLSGAISRFPVVHSDLLLNKALSLPVGTLSMTSHGSSERHNNASPHTYYSSSLAGSSGRISRPAELDASWKLDDLFDSDIEDYELSQSSEGQSSQIKVLAEVLKDGNQSGMESDPVYALCADV